MSDSSDGDESFDVLGPPSWLVRSYPPLVSKPFHLPKARFWRFGPGRVLIKFWPLYAPHVRWWDGNPTVGISLAFMGGKTRTVFFLIGGINTHLNQSVSLLLHSRVLAHIP